MPKIVHAKAHNGPQCNGQDLIEFDETDKVR